MAFFLSWPSHPDRNRRFPASRFHLSDPVWIQGPGSPAASAQAPSPDRSRALFRVSTESVTTSPGKTTIPRLSPDFGFDDPVVELNIVMQPQSLDTLLRTISDNASKTYAACVCRQAHPARGACAGSDSIDSHRWSPTVCTDFDGDSRWRRRTPCLRLWTMRIATTGPLPVPASRCPVKPRCRPERSGGGEDRHAAVGGDRNGRPEPPLRHFSKLQTAVLGTSSRKLTPCRSSD